MKAIPSDTALDGQSASAFFSLLGSSLEAIQTFSEKVPGFLDLEKQDQELLYETASLELLALRFAYRKASCCEQDELLACLEDEEAADTYTFCNGLVLHRTQVELMLGERWLLSTERLVASLRRMDIDISAFACLCALSLAAGK